MSFGEKSLYEAGQEIKIYRASIKDIKESIEEKEKRLEAESFSTDHKYKLGMEEAVKELNEISAMKFQIRIYEEEIHQREQYRKVKLNGDLYKMKLVFKPVGGKILFHLDTKGKGGETIFVYENKKLQRFRPKPSMNETSWSKEGKLIKKSMIHLIDQKYVLYENGDFAVFPADDKPNDIPTHEPENVIGNVMHLD